jgi:hypothetical protein
MARRRPVAIHDPQAQFERAVEIDADREPGESLDDAQRLYRLAARSGHLGA